MRSVCLQRRRRRRRLIKTTTFTFGMRTMHQSKMRPKSQSVTPVEVEEVERPKELSRWLACASCIPIPPTQS
eukprot:880716-Amphidinium_carterae.1